MYIYVCMLRDDFNVRKKGRELIVIAKKLYCCFYHTAFLESCYVYNIVPRGLHIKKTPCIKISSTGFTESWKSILRKSELELLNKLVEKNAYNFFKQCQEFNLIFKNHSSEIQFIEWFSKLMCILEKFELKTRRYKLRKLKRIIPHDYLQKHVVARYMEHQDCFYLYFKKELLKKFRTLPAIDNDAVILANLNIDESNSRSDPNSPNDSMEKSHCLEELDYLENTVTEEQNSQGEPDYKIAEVTSNGRLKGFFVSEHVVNLSNRKLSKAEVSLLSKGLKFCPTPNSADKSVSKEDLQIFGRTLRLKWHYRNDERTFDPNPFRPKSKFNPSKNDAAIELYLSHIEEKLLSSTEIKHSYYNLTREERQAMYNLKKDQSIVIKEADTGSAVVIWDKKDYLMEAEKQLSCKETYEEVSSDTSFLIKTIHDTLEKIRKRGDISSNILDYFNVENPKFGRFYLLPKIHKRLYDIPGRPVISNCGFYTENISAFLDHQLKPIAMQVKSYIKDTNDFLKKLRDLPDLPEDSIICTNDVVGLYPSIPNEEGLSFLRNALDKRSNKNVTTDTLIELAELVLQNNYFEFNERYLKQIRGTVIGTKFAPPYAIIYMAALEEDFLETLIKKPWLWWRYIDDIFMIWQPGEDELKTFLEKLNNFHPSIKFTCEYSREKVNYLDVQVIVREGKLITDLYVKQTDSHQYLDPSSCHPYHCTKSTPYSQVLRLNRICSENVSFDLRCNELEEWLIKRNYNPRVVRKQILKARALSRDSLLDKVKEVKNYDRLVLTLTYHPSIKSFQNVLNEAHILLTPNKEHRKVFGDKPPTIGRSKPKSLKDPLVSAKIKCEPFFR